MPPSRLAPRPPGPARLACVPPSFWPRARSHTAGMTLLEVLIVMIIVSLVMGAVVFGSGQLASARLKHTATAIVGATRIAFTRATATSKSMRLVFDLDGSALWLEEGDAPMLVQTKDKTGTGGADPATAAEQAAIAEGKSIIEGPKVPRAHFHPVKGISMTSDQVAPPKLDGGAGEGDAGGDDEDSGLPKRPALPQPTPLPRGIGFKEVQTSHDDEPRTSGRAYLYFFPGGLTERASIQLQMKDSTDDDGVLSLLVSPLTGKVTVKGGAVPLTTQETDAEKSDRDDNGGF